MKRKNQRSWAGLTACAVLVLMLAACSAASPGQEPADTADPAAATPANPATQEVAGAQGGVSGEVRYIRLDDHGTMDTMKAAAMAANPGLTFVDEVVPFDNLDSKINMAHASGQGYDLIQVNNSSVQQFYAAGVLEPLDGYFGDRMDEIREYYSPSLLEVGSVDGALYALTYAPDCRLLAYNKKILEEAGLEPPKTQQDILDISKQLSGDGVYGFARRMDTPLAPAYIEGCFLLGNGAQICSEVDGQIVATCNTPEMISSVEYWQEMTAYMPQDPNMSEDQEVQLFIQGKTVFFIYGPWNLTNDIGANMEYGVDYALMPTPGAVKNGSTAGGWYLGIGSGGKNKEGAAAALIALLDPEVMAASSGSLSPDSRSYDYPPLNEPMYKPFMDGLQTAQPPMPNMPQFNKVNEIFFEYFNKALIGGEDAAATMEACNTEIQKVLDA